jgi:hypothetical protein
MARIDRGLEPAHMSDLLSIFMNDSMDTANMKVMLQVNVLPPHASPDGRPHAQAYGCSIWHQARENADRMGFEADSVGLMEVRGEPAVDYLHSTHHAGCDGRGPRVSTVGDDVRS